MTDAYQDVIAGMGRDVYDRMVTALETGRWPDGRAVSPEQRAHAMQAVIAWGRQHLPEDQRVGFIDRGHKTGDLCDDPQPLIFTEDHQ